MKELHLAIILFLPIFIYTHCFKIKMDSCEETDMVF